MRNEQEQESRVDVSAQPDRATRSTGSTASDDGGPAFGGAFDEVLVDMTATCPPRKMERRARGMSLRAYIAVEAMAAQLACHESDHNAALVAKRACDYADALLKALKGDGHGRV